MGQRGDLQRGLMVEQPLLGQGVGDLLDFDIVERFFQHEQTVGLPDFRAHFFPGIIRIGGADNNLELGINFPDPRNRFDPVPSGRHAHVDKCHGIRTIFRQGFFHHLERFLALISRIKMKTGVLDDWRAVFEKGRLQVIHRRATPVVGTQNRPKISMDALVVVND